MASEKDIISLDVSAETLTLDEARKRFEFLRASSNQLRRDLDDGKLTLGRYKAAMDEVAKAGLDLAQSGFDVKAALGEQGGLGGAMKAVADLAESARGGMAGLTAQLPAFATEIGKSMGLSVVAMGELALALAGLYAAWKLNEAEADDWADLTRGMVRENDILSASLDGLREGWKNLRSTMSLGLWDDATQKQMTATGAARQAAADAKKRGDDAAKSMERSTGPDADARASAFGAAMDATPGGRAGVLKALYGTITATDPTAKQKQKDVLNQVLADAMTGDENAIGQIMSRLPGLNANYNPNTPTMQRERENLAQQQALANEKFFHDENIRASDKQAEFEQSKRDAAVDTERRQKQSDEAVSRLQAEYNEYRLKGNTPDPVWLKTQMKMMGYGDDDTKQIAGRVGDALAEGYQKKLEERGAERSMTPEQAEKDWKKEGMNRWRAYELDLTEARLGVGLAQAQLYGSLAGNPERIAAGDFARKAESAGQKDQLQIARDQLAVLRAIEQQNKLASHPPKLSR